MSETGNSPPPRPASPSAGIDDTDERRVNGTRFSPESVDDILEFFPGLACCCEGGVIRAINRRGRELLGYDDVGSVIGLEFDALLHDDYQGLDLVAQLLESETPNFAMMLRADGGKLGVRIGTQWARELGHDVCAVYAEDVSRRMELSSDILSSEARFRALVENALDMICACEDGIVRFINKAGLTLIGAKDQKAVVGKPVPSLFHPDYREAFSTTEALHALFDERALFPAKLAHADGSHIDVHVSVTADNRSDGRMMIEVRDISELRSAVMALHQLNKDLDQKVRERTKELAAEVELRRQAEDRMRHMATHDTLTGLPNRQLLADRIDSAISRARRDRKKIAVLFIDLDGFKAVNDTHGHEGGDAVLRTVASKLIDQTRETDTVARLGGDEFVVVYSDIVDVGVAATLAERILASLAKPIPLPNGRDGYVGASIGVAIYPEHGTNSAAIMKCADDVMYVVKRSGKNNYMFVGAEAGARG